MPRTSALCPPCLAGREPPAGCRGQHQDCRLWLQQRVHAGLEAGHVLWEPPIRRPGAVPRQEVRRAGGGHLEPRRHPVHARQRLPALRRAQPQGAGRGWPRGSDSPGEGVSGLHSPHPPDPPLQRPGGAGPSSQGKTGVRQDRVGVQEWTWQLASSWQAWIQILFTHPSTQYIVIVYHPRVGLYFKFCRHGVNKGDMLLPG